MSDLLNVGASAVGAYSAALGVIGENVANAQTDGYARRSATISSIAPNQGSIASGVTRAWDQYRASDALSATADDGRASAAATWLDAAEGAVDSSDSGVGAQVTAVFTAGSTLAADPTNSTARAQMLGAIGGAARSISSAASQLAKVSGGIGDAANDGVTGVNTDLSALAKVNAAMQRTADNTDAKASLADQRDKLLADLSGRIGVDARIGTDGTATVSLAGSAGVPLVAGTKASLLSVAQAADGRLSFTAGLGRDVAPANPTGGTLAGLADAANGVAGQRGALDELATGLATQLNAWNAQGRTSNGAAGGALLATTGGAAGLALAATSGDAIAAAGADGSSNGNLVALSDLRGPDGTEARLNALVGTSAQALASAKAQASAAATRKTSALTAQADVNGVSLDQQAADLVRYQQAYQASTKIIQAAQTTMNSILSLFGG